MRCHVDERIEAGNGQAQSLLYAARHTGQPWGLRTFEKKNENRELRSKGNALQKGRGVSCAASFGNLNVVCVLASHPDGQSSSGMEFISDPLELAALQLFGGALDLHLVLISTDVSWKLESTQPLRQFIYCTAGSLRTV